MQNNPGQWMKAVNMLSPQDYTNTAPTVATEALVIDTLGYEELFIILNVDTVAGTSIVVKVVEATAVDGTTGAVDVTDAVFTTITTANDVALLTGRVNLRGRLRYIVLDFTFSSVTASPMSAVGILCGARSYPVTQVPALDFQV